MRMEKNYFLLHCRIKEKMYICTLFRKRDKELITEGRVPCKINVICQLESDFKDTERKENPFIGS